MKKISVFLVLIMMMLVSVVGITYSYEYKDSESVVFNLNGPYEIELELGQNYFEYGVVVTKNGIDISDKVNINNSDVDINKVGEYKVKYELLIDGNIEYIYRKVSVREYIKPVINLLGEDIIYLNLNENYIESGYVVNDNYDTDLNNKVVIKSNLDVNKVGQYSIEYSVFDTSGNEGIAIRNVIVK